MKSVYHLWIDRARETPDAPALIDDELGEWVTHGALSDMADKWKERISATSEKPLVFLAAESRVRTVAAWLGAWKAGAVVALVNPALAASQLRPVIEAYQPDMLIGFAGLGGEGFGFEPGADEGVWSRNLRQPGVSHADIGLLLFTSGTTGSPKAVRLRAAGVAHNTSSIIESLGLGPEDRVLAHLSLNYSYGMSVVNSHLAAGGSAVLTRHSLASPALWGRARGMSVTAMPMVPAQMKLLHRLKFNPETFCPSLTSLTQAGGKVDAETLNHFAGLMRAKGGRLFVMYGQTEASPRMACQELTSGSGDPDSAGFVLSGGAFDIRSEDGRACAPGETGIVHYRGPNVMMGYAESAADLALEDQNQGALDTGDVGYLSVNGMLYIVGRSKRFAKIGGIRCNLDELERAAEQISSPAAVLPTADSVIVFWIKGALENPKKAGAELARAMGVPVDAVYGREVDVIPLLESGKTNYTALKEFAS
jgi:acyl-CoA synthetase (AMP-forming)/AMP-acid ligase II